MNIPARKTKPSVQDQVGSRRMLMLTAAADKQLDRRERRLGRHINDGDFVICGRKPKDC